jgi:hypothetical protein
MITKTKACRSYEVSKHGVGGVKVAHPLLLERLDLCFKLFLVLFDCLNHNVLVLKLRVDL